MKLYPFIRYLKKEFNILPNLIIVDKSNPQIETIERVVFLVHSKLGWKPVLSSDLPIHTFISIPDGKDYTSNDDELVKKSKQYKVFLSKISKFNSEDYVTRAFIYKRIVRNIPIHPSFGKMLLNKIYTRFEPSELTFKL